MCPVHTLLDLVGFDHGFLAGTTNLNTIGADVQDDCVTSVAAVNDEVLALDAPEAPAERQELASGQEGVNITDHQHKLFFGAGAFLLAKGSGHFLRGAHRSILHATYYRQRPCGVKQVFFRWDGASPPCPQNAGAGF